MTQNIIKQKGEKTGFRKHLWLKIIGGIVGLFVIFFGSLFLIHTISNGLEKSKIEVYGQLVDVDGKKMNVFIQGEGEETIVLLPGQGTPSPVLDFKLLIDELSPSYKVVVVEPFGYGLSDLTDKERTSENIVSEIHGAVEQLGLKRYILMGHSIAGLYGISYVEAYGDEVIAFVGIDSSVPNQPGMDADLPLKTMSFLQKSGIIRFSKWFSDPYEGMAFDEHTKQQMSLISNRVTSNANMINELENLSANFSNGKSLAYPAELPVLLFVQAHDDDVRNWVGLHEEQASKSNQGKAIVMEGSHYLHHTKYKEIAEEFKAYMAGLSN